MRETQILESQCRNQLGILCTVKVLPKIDQITSSWRKLKPENDILGTEMKTEILNARRNISDENKPGMAKS